MDISRPCKLEKLIPLLPWTGFDPSFSGHNNRRAIISKWIWLRIRPLSHRGWLQGYGDMHHWVKYCVNRCKKSEVITLTSFVTDGRTDAQHFYVPPNGFTMAGDKYHDLGWMVIRHTPPLHLLVLFIPLLLSCTNMVLFTTRSRRPNKNMCVLPFIGPNKI